MHPARVAELVDAQDSGSCGSNPVGVRLPPRASVVRPGGGTGRRASLRGWWPQGRGGSNPLLGMTEGLVRGRRRTYAPVAQLDRAPDYGSGGWGFEFSRAHGVPRREPSPRESAAPQARRREFRLGRSLGPASTIVYAGGPVPRPFPRRLVTPAARRRSREGD